MWLWFRVVFDNVIDLIDLLSIESQKCFLDLEDFQSVCYRSRGLGIWYCWFLSFRWFLGFNWRFAVLKILGYDIDLSFWFFWEGRWQRNLLYRDQDGFGCFLIVLVGCWWDSRSELRQDLCPKCCGFIVSIKRVLVRLVY